MKNFSLIILVLIIGCSDNKQKPTVVKADFNYEAAEGYFKLVDTLSRGKVISDREWDIFFQIKGNRLYIEENNISVEYINNLKAIIEFTYTPGSDSLLELRAREDIFYRIRKMYIDNDSIFRQHLAWLKRNDSEIVDSMVSRTKKFLPNNALTTDSIPKIYYHALDHEGSANSKGIFVSIMAAYQNNTRRLANIEAHEFHHIQRPSIIREIKLEEIDKGLIWALDAALSEGLADMVDKDVMLSEDSKYWLKEMAIDFYVGQASGVITELDKLILDELHGKHHSEEAYRAIYLGGVGHVPGYYMANTIKINGRLQEVIENAGNPFSFFIIYNDVTSENRTNYPVFSLESINYLKKLKEDYARTYYRK